MISCNSRSRPLHKEVDFSLANDDGAWRLRFRHAGSGRILDRGTTARSTGDRPHGKLVGRCRRWDRASLLDRGTGAPVVLLHGWPETGYAWRYIAPRLIGAGYQVIVPDLRGLGNSSRSAGGYDRQTMAEDVRRLVRERLHLGPVLLVGHDWGGSTAAAWASAHPNEVRRLVVIEAQPRGPWSQPEPRFYSFHRAPGFAEAMTAGRERPI
jgi:pimeloyl-ACP methyl ester carboxylesterase